MKKHIGLLTGEIESNVDIQQKDDIRETYKETRAAFGMCEALGRGVQIQNIQNAMYCTSQLISDMATTKRVDQEKLGKVRKTYNFHIKYRGYDKKESLEPVYKYIEYFTDIFGAPQTIPRLERIIVDYKLVETQSVPVFRTGYATEDVSIFKSIFEQLQELLRDSGIFDIEVKKKKKDTSGFTD